MARLGRPQGGAPTMPLAGGAANSFRRIMICLGTRSRISYLASVAGRTQGRAPTRGAPTRSVVRTQDTAGAGEREGAGGTGGRQRIRAGGRAGFGPAPTLRRGREPQRAWNTPRPEVREGLPGPGGAQPCAPTRVAGREGGSPCDTARRGPDRPKCPSLRGDRSGRKAGGDLKVAATELPINRGPRPRGRPGGGGGRPTPA